MAKCLTFSSMPRIGPSPADKRHQSTKVAHAIRDRTANGVDQIVFYHDGIGTRGLADRITDAWRLPLDNSPRSI